MRPPVLVVLVVLSFCAYGQKADSLLNELSHPHHDTVKLNILDQVIELQSQDYAAIEKYSLQLQELSKSNAEKSTGKLRETYLRHYATALNNLAYVEENKSNTAGAVESYEKALSIFREINNKTGQAMCLTNLGFVSKKTGDLANAIVYYEKAMELNKESGDKAGLYASTNNLGLAFYALGDIKKAMAMYFEALKVAEELADKRRQARMFNNIAGVYQAQKEPRLHREYLEKALAMITEAGEKRGEAAILNNLIPLLVNEKEFDRGKQAATRVFEISESLSDKQLMCTALSSLALVSKSTGKFDEAVKFEKQSLALETTMGNKMEMIGSLNQLGDIYLTFNKSNEAIPYFKQSVELSQAVGYANGISRAAKNLFESYKRQGNTVKALEYYELYIKMRDSVTNEENRKATFKSQYKYEYEIKATADSIRAQGERAVLTAQLSQVKSQRYALTAAVILGVTLASFAFYRFRVKQEMKELQLRNRIASDLHDEVGSAISSISLFAGLAKMRSGKDTDDIVSKIENTSRETVDNMSDIVWSIEPANDRFDNVIRKMKYFGDQLLGGLGIGFTFNYDSAIEKSTFDMAKRKNIYLIYKEAVNNAAKYSGAGNVNVSLSKDGRQYKMEIADDGKGFDASTATVGNGLRNMKRRAEEMRGNLVINSTAKGTAITLVI